MFLIYDRYIKVLCINIIVFGKRKEFRIFLKSSILEFWYILWETFLFKGWFNMGVDYK